MTKGLLRSISRAPAGKRDAFAVRLSVNATVTVDGATGVGFGTAVIGELPEGHLLLLGARADLTATTAAAGVVVDWEGDFGIGTTPDADGTLATTEVNLIASTSIVATGGAKTATAAANNVTQAVIDNSDNAGEVNLNLIVDDADISADDVEFTVTGYVTIALVVLGDD